MFSVILEEIQRTSCQPREVCIEVSKEYPESTSQFYLPRCVALHRCGGCCTNEAYYCTNTSHSLVNKTVSTWILTFLSSAPLHGCAGILCSYTSNGLRTEDRNQCTQLYNQLICITSRPHCNGTPFGCEWTSRPCNSHKFCNTYINSCSTNTTNSSSYCQGKEG